ncbi:helix-turn-helix domain-containing protein [Larkinella terrae]|uniref:Helix-turn-helix domain-containing protein n=1 Tax=Larkinella terrae TaxID=2025311 RepID=A0A7K0ENF1_9BACT|nr:helix-turn-helix domain-containing protein [Larkinella terrae]MRS62978.1 helix-turn-helix domain-containing protein [Larkinella terrae]
MNLARYLPTDCLKPFVKEFLIVESIAETGNRVLPDTSIVLAFRFKGTVVESGETNSNLPVSVITGLRKSSRVLNYSANSSTLLVLFREGGAAAFFREPLHELFSQSRPLDELIQPQKLEEVEDRLAGAKTNPQRIAIIEQFLISKRLRSGPEPLLAQAVMSIKIAHGKTGIKSLAESLSISQDAFEKRFRKAVGTSPKQFAELVRFRYLITAQSADRSLTDLAYEAGYFDQAHFIKDFRTFTGQAPQDFFKSALFW